MVQLGRLEKIIYVLMIIALVVVGSGDVKAAMSPAPAVYEYQAHVVPANRAALDGTHTVYVLIYDSPTLGVAGDLASNHLLYAEVHQGMKLERGWLRVGIGEGTPVGPYQGMQLPVERIASSPELYLQIGIDNELVAPRQRINVNPNAYQSTYALLADNLDGSFVLTAANLPANGFDASRVVGEIDKSRFPSSLSPTLLSGTLSGDRLEQLPLSLISGQLPLDRIGKIESANITTGTFPASAIPATVYQQGSIQVYSGDAGNGSTLPHVDGKCAWIVGMSNLLYGDEGQKDIVNLIQVSADGDANVTCKTTGWEKTKYCTARYLVVCLP